jgi:rubrerythrin
MLESTEREAEEIDGCIVGRRSAGLAGECVYRTPGSPAQYLASAAYFEAASVHAFERLASELLRERAPKRLVRAALRSAEDEVRHARVMARWARRAGAVLEVPRFAAPVPRSLEAIATENAVEGCANETYSAALLALQARRARHPQLRAGLRRIARDELRHAALAWELRTWFDARLTAAAKRRVNEALLSSAQSLAIHDEPEPSPELRELAGVPDAAMRRALLEPIRRRIVALARDSR